MNFGQIDRVKAEPPFAQIKQLLRQAITSGQLAPGQRLPTETKLAEHFGVARTTVRRPLRELCGEGLLVSVPGRGLAVRPAAFPFDPDAPRDGVQREITASHDDGTSQVEGLAGRDQRAVALLIARANEWQAQMRTLAAHIATFDSLTPSVVEHLVRELARIALVQADMVATLAVRVNDVDGPDPAARANEVFQAARANLHAHRAALSLAEVLRRSQRHDEDNPTEA